MLILETPIFTKRVDRVLEEESYRLLQVHLLHRPDAGDMIRGSGGIRKIRWASSGSGKRGGARVIYYWAVKKETVLMLFVFEKSERDDLTPDQVKQLAEVVREEFK
jgi:mRNA-degrading endonuclease RelE of RelBE toxin-antitoxin system